MAWRFHRGVDSPGEDVANVGVHVFADDLIGAALTGVPTAAAVNTLGFVKGAVSEPLRASPFLSPDKDGIYVRGPETTPEAAAKLAAIHKAVLFSGGPGDDAKMWERELPEQQLMAELIPPGATVLELGGNVGRGTCVLASLLDDSSRLVTVEPNPEYVAALYGNRVANKFGFNVECGAISRQPLVLHMWTALPRGTPGTEGWAPVLTFPYAALRAKYAHLAFDTLVVDAEGALFHILREEPGFLDGFKLVLVENDYKARWHKCFVDAEMQRCGLTLVYSRDGAPFMPCARWFFQAWAKV